MFILALIIGLYSYIIFALGILGILYDKYLLTIIVLFLVILLFYLASQGLALRSYRLRSRDKLIVILIIIQVFVNIVGALGPELAFDATWYHLTLPKIYLEQHKISFVPGGLFYYSTMPKLTEMLYIPAVSFGSEIWAKLIHFAFGISILFVLYKLSRKFLNQTLSLLVILIFYTNLVVGWMSITAYIDLARTFFELLAFYAFIERRFLLSSLMLGLAISTKLVAIVTNLVFVVLIRAIKPAILFIFISLLVASPWFIFSYLTTGNPVYPVFSRYVPGSLEIQLLNPLRFVSEIVSLFTTAADPVSPIYLIILPLAIPYLSSFNKKERLVGTYCLIALIVWYLIPHAGGGRFILPYLPVFSLLAMIVVSKIREKLIVNFIMVITVILAISSIGYRAIANKKYLPVILGKQTKSDFLTKNLNFNFGDFYDVDGYFKSTIKPTDKVLIYGIHNLFYVNFPFIHESYVKPDDKFNYVLVGEGELPQRFSTWKLIYSNKLTRVKLYACRSCLRSK